MDVRKLQTSKEISLVRKGNEVYELKTYEDINYSLSKINKQKVYKGTKKHFTKIDERDSRTGKDVREVYYELEDGELPLDTFRLMASDEDSKQDILDGLLELFFLVSEGKIYNIELNPFNFIVSEGEDRRVKSFYREDRGLREITDEWLYEVKKLIGYFLVSDTKYSEDNYAYLKPKDFYRDMEDNIASQYLKIMRSNSLDHIVQEWFTEIVYKQLKGFPSMLREHKKPKDVTSLTVAMGLENEEDDNEEIEEDTGDDDEVKDNNIKKENSFSASAVIDKIKENKYIMYGGIALAVVILVFIIIKMIPEKEDIKEPEEKENLQEQTLDVNETFYEGVILASVQKYDEASEVYEKMEDEEIQRLEEDEKVSIYLTYLKTGNYDEALKVDPDGAETLVRFLKNKDKIQEIKEMDSDHNVINYEKAVLDEDYETIVSLKGKVKDTEDRRKEILKAYVYTDDLDGAVEYVKEKDSKKMKEYLEDVYKKYSKDKGVKKDKRKKNIKDINKI